MSLTDSLIPELQDIIRHGSRQRRAEALQRITGLFIDGAERFTDEHVRLFDEVFTRLIEEIEIKVRAELSTQLAPIENAPTETVRRLAKDDDIRVALPVLTQSKRLDDAALADVAKTKSQAHLLAISGRAGIGVSVTDVLVRRGDRTVVRHVADNSEAKLSEGGFSTLVQRADKDGVLAEKVGQRPDIPAHMFRELLLRASEVVQQRLLAKAKPETQAEIRNVLKKVTDEVASRNPPRDFTAAREAVMAMHKAGKLDEAALVAFANDGRYEEVAVALAILSSVPVDVVDRLMSGKRPDPILILCKAAGWGWPTARALIGVRPYKGPSSQTIDDAHANMQRLARITAQRVVRFWQVHPPATSQVA